MWKHGWLLPSELRFLGWLLDVGCAGMVVLASTGHYAGRELLLGMAAAVVVFTALTVWPAPPPRRRETLAAVVSASPPPEDDRASGPCTMTLRVMQPDGSEVEVVHTDARAPRLEWPKAEADLVVAATRGRRPKVQVLWYHGVTYPQPAASPDRPGLPSPVPDGSPSPVSPAAPIDPDDRTEPIRYLGSSFTGEFDFDDDDFDLLPAPSRPDPVDLVQKRIREPSDLIRSYLFPTEKFRAEFRRHWVRLIGNLALGLGLAVFLQYGLPRLPSIDDRAWDLSATVVHLAAAAFWAAWLLWRGPSWLVDRFVLTNKRLIAVSGLLGRRAVSLPLVDAAKISLSCSWLGKLLGYGTLRFPAAPPLQALRRVAHLPFPRDIYLQVVQEVYEPEATDVRLRPAYIDDGL